MKISLTIDKLTEKEVKTQYGDKKKWVLQFREKEGVWLDSFQGNWNKDWKLNDMVEIDKETQIKTREYQGKTYFSVVAPPEARGGFQQIQVLMNSVKDLQDRVQALEMAQETKEPDVVYPEEEKEEINVPF